MTPHHGTVMRSQAPRSPMAPNGRDADSLAWWVVVLRGLYALLFGCLLLMLLIVHARTLINLFGLYALGDGCLVIAGLSQSCAGVCRRYLVLSEGLLGIFVGALAAAMGPHGAIDLVCLVVPWTLLRGAAWVYGHRAAAFGRVARAYAIGVSLLFTAEMLFSLGNGRLLITLGLGVYSALFGAGHLEWGVRLRRLESQGS